TEVQPAVCVSCHLLLGRVRLPRHQAPCDSSARNDAEVEDPMTVQDLENLFDYGHWANRKLFAMLSQLTPEQLTQPVTGSHGSIRNTMVHVLGAEWGWLDRCGGPKRGAALHPSDYPTVATLTALWNQV